MIALDLDVARLQVLLALSHSLSVEQAGDLKLFGPQGQPLEVCAMAESASRSILDMAIHVTVTTHLHVNATCSIGICIPWKLEHSQLAVSDIR